MPRSRESIKGADPVHRHTRCSAVETEPRAGRGVGATVTRELFALMRSPRLGYARLVVIVRCVVAVFVVMSAMASPASAQSIGASQAIEEALGRNPDVVAAVAELHRARAVALAESARYGATLRLEAGVTRTEQPTATTGAVRIGEFNSAQLAAQIEQRFSFGLVAAARVEGTARHSRVNPFPTTDTLVEIGPNYGVDVTLTVAQPLLRGAFDDVGLAALEAAEIDVDATTLARARTANQLALEVGTAYWELWYALEQMRVQTRSKELAEQREADARARVERGLGAEIDVLPFATRGAALSEAVLTSRLEARRRSLELLRLLGRERGDVTPEETAPEMPEAIADIDALVRRATASSLELQGLEAQVERARLGVRIAGEALRPRLDVDAYVALRGLGAEDAVAPFEQIAGLDALSAHIGLIYELPLDGTQREAERTRAESMLEAATATLEAARLRVATDIEVVARRLSESIERAQLASRTVALARQLYEAETHRLDLGTSTPTQVLAAEEELRNAELRLARARVDAVLAEAAVAHATGDLLMRYEPEQSTRAARR